MARGYTLNNAQITNSICVFISPFTNALKHTKTMFLLCLHYPLHRFSFVSFGHVFFMANYISMSYVRLGIDFSGIYSILFLLHV